MQLTRTLEPSHKLEKEYGAMSSSCAKVIGEKEKLTRSLQKTTEDYDENISNLVTKHETKIREIEDTIRAKDTIISSLKAKQIDIQIMPVKQLKCCLKGDTMFRIKPKKKTNNKNIDLNSYNCESCSSTLLDLIKCNL